MPFREPVEIIGAGPAGLTAAIVLRRYGLPVTVYERAADVGSRLNGDFQGIENWSSAQDATDLLREMGIAINFRCVPVHGGSVFTGGGRRWTVRSDRPIFYLVQRGGMKGSLDSGLREQALAMGAEIRFGRRVEEFQARTIVGTGPREVHLVATGMTFSTSADDLASVILDDEVVPKGYAYLLVSSGQGTLATFQYREYHEGNAGLERSARVFASSLGVEVRNERRFGGFGNFSLRESPVRDGRLYVGEAAGFQDCLWGFGMRYAFLSGFLAARSLAEEQDYEELWRRELRPQLETSLVNRFLFERFGDLGYRYLARQCAKGGPCGFLRMHYNPSFLKRLLLPLAKRRYSMLVREDGGVIPRQGGEVSE